MAKSIKDWEAILNTELVNKTHSDTLLLLIKNWHTKNENLRFFNMDVYEHGEWMLRDIRKKIKFNTTEDEINDWFNQRIALLNEFKKLAETVPVDNNRNDDDEVEALLAYVPLEQTINQDEENERNTNTALTHAEAAQNLAGFSGGVISASVQEAADHLARTTSTPSQTLIALRDPLPPNIAAGAHIASVAASGLNLIVFPVILLRAYLRGEKVTLSRDDRARLLRSAVTLGLGIAGLIVAPAIAIPLMISSAVFTAATTLIGLGNFLWERRNLNKEIDAKRDKAKSLTTEIKALQKKAADNRGFLATELRRESPNETKIALYKKQLEDANQAYTTKTVEQGRVIAQLKTLTQTRNRQGLVRQILPRSLGFIVAATIITGAVLLLVPPLAPIGIGIIIGGSAAGIALMAGVITSHVLLTRKGKKEEQQKANEQIEKQKVEKVSHETTADLAKSLGITNSELSHAGRVREITGRLKEIIAMTQTQHSIEGGKKALIRFFVTYAQIHQDDSIATLKARPIFNEIPEDTRNYVFNLLRLIVNKEKGKLITPEDLAILKEFDKKHSFFEAHSVGITDLKPYQDPNAAAKNKASQEDPQGKPRPR